MMTILAIFKFYKITIYFIYLIRLLFQFFKKDYKTWEERYESNEFYTVLDFWVKDKNRMEKKHLIGFFLSKLIKFITKIQSIICLILLIPTFLGYIECRRTKNIFRKFFWEIPIAYCEIIKEVVFLKKKIKKDDKKSLLNNFFFSQVYERSRWNLIISIDMTKILINIVTKEPRIKEKKFIEVLKSYSNQILIQNFNEILDKQIEKKTRPYSKWKY